jgi:hypothetical protein
VFQDRLSAIPIFVSRRAPRPALTDLRRLLRPSTAGSPVPIDRGQRTGERFRESDAFQTKAKGARVALTALEIGNACVLAQRVPRDLPVLVNRNNGKDTAHGLVPLAEPPGASDRRSSKWNALPVRPLKSGTVLNRFRRRCRIMALIGPYSRLRVATDKNVTRVVERSNGQSFGFVTCRYRSKWGSHAPASDLCDQYMSEKRMLSLSVRKIAGAV